MLDTSTLGATRARAGRTAGVANLVFAATQPVAAYVTKLTGRGVSEAERASKVDGPVSPAPGAFVIWLPLFVTSLAHGAHISRAPRLTAPVRRVTWLMSAAYASNAAWSLQAQLRGLGWPSVAIISAATASASAALIEAESASERQHEARLSARAAAPLAGWLTLATFANIEATLNQTTSRPDPRAETRRALALLAASSATAAGIAVYSRGNRLYTAAVAWGLGGVMIRNIRSRNVSVAVAAGSAFALAAGATIFGRKWLASRR
jgi:hypothetical protein